MSELPPVVSFVAKSGMGKTMLLEALIPQLKARGLRVGVLKHHKHLSSFDTPEGAENASQQVRGCAAGTLAGSRIRVRAATGHFSALSRLDGCSCRLQEGYTV